MIQRRYLTTFILTLIIASALNLYGQKFPKVTEAMVHEATHPEYPDVEAAILWHHGLLSIDYLDARGEFVLTRDVKLQIKIYTEDGVTDYGEIAIPLYYRDPSTRETVSGIKATTYNLQDGKLVEAKLTRKEVFEEATSDNWRTTKFALPNVRPGTIVEVEYNTTSPFIREISDWRFQRSVPVHYSAVSTSIPEWLSYRITMKGTLIPKRTQNIRTAKLGSGTYIKNYEEFVMQDVPPLNDEPYVTSMDNYYSSIRWELLAAKFPNAIPKYYTESWEQIAKELNDNTSFGGFLKAAHKDLEAIVTQCKRDSQTATAQALHEYLTSRLRWNGAYRVYASQKIGELLSSNQGSTAELNLLYIKLLRMAGLEATPFVSKPRHQGLLNTSYPSMTDLGQTLTYLKADGKEYYINIANNDVPFGQLHPESLNYFGVIVAGERGVETTIKNPNQLASTTYTNLDLSPDGVLEGDLSYKLDHLTGTTFRRASRGKDPGWEKALGTRATNSEETAPWWAPRDIKQIEITNLNQPLKAVIIKEGSILQDRAEVIKDDIILQCLLGYGYRSNPFRSEKRDFPIFLDGTVKEDIILNITLPEHYEAIDLPKSFRMELPESLGYYSFQIEVVESKISVVRKLEIRQDYLLPTLYTGIREAFDKIVEADNGHVLIRKRKT